VTKDDRITSIRQAAAASGVSPPVIRRWLTLDLIPEPPWTVRQLQEVRDLTDPEGRRLTTKIFGVLIQTASIGLGLFLGYLAFLYAVSILDQQKYLAFLYSSDQ
jgi:hypothetical protein